LSNYSLSQEYRRKVRAFKKLIVSRAETNSRPFFSTAAHCLRAFAREWRIRNGPAGATWRRPRAPRQGGGIVRRRAEPFGRDVPKAGVRKRA
jgi:hypothetical protein